MAALRSAEIPAQFHFGEQHMKKTIFLAAFVASAQALTSIVNAQFIFADRFENRQPEIIFLNDTGIQWCASGSANGLKCPISSFPAQDGEFGRDYDASLGKLSKDGSGAAGFDFTKVSADGRLLAENASEWTCVLDNHTGLLWEKKTASGLRRSSNSYSWYHPDPSVNGGDPGGPDLGDCTGSDCDTYSYIKEVNNRALCDQSDWRLPKIQELQSLTDYSKMTVEEIPTIDSDFFPHTYTSNYYWSNTLYAGENTRVHCASYLFGAILENCIKGNPDLRIRAVRGPDRETASATTPEDSAHCADYILSETPLFEFGSGSSPASVVHVSTGIEWARCPVGMQHSSGSCEGEPTFFTWQEALVYAESVSGWRLPNVKELFSIVDTCALGPSINPEVFPSTPAVRFWTNTPWSTSPGSARVVDFHFGSPAGNIMSVTRAIRLMKIDAE